MENHHHHLHSHKHSHTHGAVDLSIVSSEKGIRAVKISFIGLAITAIMQIVVVVLSGSVALLADTIHNVGDAVTAVPLWIAFAFAKMKPTKKFTYGYGKVEDLAGVTIVLIIFFSAIVAGYESVQRFIHPQEIKFLWAIITASVIGFLGNEAVAVYRIRTGKEISSAALIADGYHARVDGFTSLAVLFSAVGVWLGYPIADPIIGLLITITILKIVWDASKMIFTRFLDGVEPIVLEEIEHSIGHIINIESVKELRARWIGHQLNIEMTLSLSDTASLTEIEILSSRIKEELHHHMNYVSTITIQSVSNKQK
jgi:cation diffusion facilitator family transporter